MPNTIQSLLIVIIFLAPGYYLVHQTRKKMPLFHAKASQLELIVLLCLLSLIPLIILLISVFIVILSISAVSRSSGPLSAFLTWDIRNIIAQNLQALEIRRILLFVAYVSLSFAIAHMVGICFSRWASKRKPGRVNPGSAWLDAFSQDRVNFVSARLDNDYTVIGKVFAVQTDVEALISGKRDLVLNSVTIVDPDGYYQKDSTAELVIINSRDIRILEITTESIDNHGTTELSQELDSGATRY